GIFPPGTRKRFKETEGASSDYFSVIGALSPRCSGREREHLKILNSLLEASAVALLHQNIDGLTREIVSNVGRVLSVGGHDAEADSVRADPFHVGVVGVWFWPSPRWRWSGRQIDGCGQDEPWEDAERA